MDLGLRIGPRDKVNPTWLEGAKDARDVAGLDLTGVLMRFRKTRNINIRIAEFGLDRLKSISAQEGLPYQTLISSVLHKFVTKQLVD